MAYRKAGRAILYCPEISRQTQGLHASLLTDEELAAVDGEGHTEWVFSWSAGAQYINHASHAHLRKCSLCGRELELVAGDDPFGPDA